MILSVCKCGTDDDDNDDDADVWVRGWHSNGSHSNKSVPASFSSVNVVTLTCNVMPALHNDICPWRALMSCCSETTTSPVNQRQTTRKHYMQTRSVITWFVCGSEIWILPTRLNALPSHICQRSWCGSKLCSMKEGSPELTDIRQVFAVLGDVVRR